MSLKSQKWDIDFFQRIDLIETHEAQTLNFPKEDIKVFLTFEKRHLRLLLKYDNLGATILNDKYFFAVLLNVKWRRNPF